MTKLRENTGVILWILVFAFGVIWVLQDSGGLENIGMQEQQGDIVVVDGDPVTYQEFREAVDAQEQQFRQQTGQDLTPQMRDELQDNVFDALVEDRLLEREMDRLGIRVTDEELEEMVLGDNPHPIIRTYFGGEDGQVDRQLLLSFINNPDARQDWIQMEEFLRAQRRQEKLRNLIGATVRVSDQDVRDEYRRRNLQVDLEYVALPYAEVSDDEIEVTEQDLRDYYNENREDFRRERTYTLEFTSLPKQATEEDSAQVADELEALRDRFEETENDSLFLARNASQQSFTREYFTADELDPPVATAIFEDPSPGRIVGPVFTDELAHLIKIRDVRPADETAVRARHILFQDGEQAQEQIQEVQRQLEEGADFAEMARVHSEGPSGPQGGDLGWFTRGQMTEAFEQAAFNASIGEVVGPIETEFGLHLILVEDRTTQEVQIADLAYSSRPSPATLHDLEERLGDVAYYAEDSGFAEEVERQDLELNRTQVEADQQNIPQLGRSRTIQNFLEGASAGDISEVIELDDRFVVLHVADVQSAGYRPFDEVQNEIRPRVERQKKQEVQMRRLRETYDGTNFDALPQALDTQLRSFTGLQYDTRSVPGIGNDQTFTGTALGLNEGQTSRPIAGENAAYVLRVTDVQEPPAMDDATRAQLRQELENRRRQQIQQQWINSLRDEARIDDRRAQFEL